MLTLTNTTPISEGVKLLELLKRPQLSYFDFSDIDNQRPILKPYLANKLEIEIKYAGYIEIEREQIEKMRKLEQKALPTDIDYREIRGLRLEAQEKLNKLRPLNVGQAGRISGVNPADVSVLLIWLASKNSKGE